MLRRKVAGEVLVKRMTGAKPLLLPLINLIITARPLTTKVLAKTQAETLAAPSNVREHKGPTGVKSHRSNLTRNPWTFVSSASFPPKPRTTLQNLHTPSQISKLVTPLPKNIIMGSTVPKPFHGLKGSLGSPGSTYISRLISLSMALAMLRFSTLSKYTLIFPGSCPLTLWPTAFLAAGTGFMTIFPRTRV